MNREETVLFKEFLYKVPNAVFNNKGVLKTAEFFIWGMLRSLPNHPNVYLLEILDCFTLAGLQKPSEYYLRKKLDEAPGIIKPRNDRYAIGRLRLPALDNLYSKYLEFALPTEEELAREIKVTQPEILSSEEVTSAIKVMRVFVMLFWLENATRKWININLTKVMGDNWWDQLDSRENEARFELKTFQLIKLADVKRNAQKVMDREKLKGTPLLTSRTDSLLSFCDWADLFVIIDNARNVLQRESNTSTLHQISSRLHDLEPFRNRIAHSGTLNDDEIGRVEGYYKDLIKLLLLRSGVPESIKPIS